MDPNRESTHKADYPARREAAQHTPFGIGGFPPPTQSALEVPEADRNAAYESKWQEGGSISFLYTYTDLLTNQEANDTAADFVRNKIRGIVEDSETAELLCPNDHPMGTKRLVLDTGYYETYNQPHVTLVDIAKTGIERFTESGVVANGVEYALDVVVCATGFAAMTGSFDKINFTGRDGLTLKEKWAAGPRTYLGLTSVGFPNLFMLTGPGSPSVLASLVQAIEQHVDWVADCVAHMRDVGAASIEPTLADEDAWVEHVNEVAEVSLRSTCSSWYVGANIPGRPRVFMPYIGGFPIYVNKCNEVMDAGYEGFTLDGAADTNTPPRIRLTERWHVPLDMDVISPAALAAKRVPVV